MFTIKQRDVPEQLVLTEQRRVRADELSDFLFAAIGRLMGSPTGLGGPAGALLVVAFPIA
jgi:hypothetical protein